MIEKRLEVTETSEEQVTIEFDGLTIALWRSRLDKDRGQPVVQIDGSGMLRVNVNDYPIWNADPDDHEHEQCECVTEFEEDEEPDFPFEELDARFTKLPNPSDPSEADHWEHADAVKMPLNQVWTVVEGDSGSHWWAVTGFHIVNKLFYVVTQESWTDEDSGKNFRY